MVYKFKVWKSFGFYDMEGSIGPKSVFPGLLNKWVSSLAFSAPQKVDGDPFI